MNNFPTTCLHCNFCFLINNDKYRCQMSVNREITDPNCLPDFCPFKNDLYNPDFIALYEKYRVLDLNYEQLKRDVIQLIQLINKTKKNLEKNMTTSEKWTYEETKEEKERFDRIYHDFQRKKE